MRGIWGNINFPTHPSIEKPKKISEKKFFPNPNEKIRKSGVGERNCLTSPPFLRENLRRP